MKYYQFNFLLELADGNYNAVAENIRNNPFGAFNPRHYTRIPSAEPPDFIPDLDAFYVHEESILTDYVNNYVINAHLFSNRLAAIFKTAHLPPIHRFWPAVVDHYDETRHTNYELFQSWNDEITPYIDFEKTKLYFQFDSSTIPISDYSEYLFYEQKRGSNEFPNSLFTNQSKIVYLKFTDNPLDFFYNKLIGSGYYISERLKNRLEEAGIIGYECIDNGAIRME